MVSKLKQYLNRFASKQLVEESSSGLHNTLEVVRVGEKTLLNSANTNYSFGGLHRVFQKAFKEIKLENRAMPNVLLLGFGAGSVASILQEELKLKCRITAVEKDPEVIRLGEEYFNIHRFRDLEIIEQDAAEYMAKADNMFDLIIVDVYVDFEVPGSCETIEFVKSIDACLAQGGLMLFNKLIYNHVAAREAGELEEKFRSLPGNTSTMKIRENVLNKIIVYEKKTGTQ